MGGVRATREEQKFTRGGQAGNQTRGERGRINHPAWEEKRFRWTRKYPVKPSSQRGGGGWTFSLEEEEEKRGKARRHSIQEYREGGRGRTPAQGKHQKPPCPRVEYGSDMSLIGEEA